MLTKEELHKVVNYDKYTGLFKWIVRTSKRQKIGDIAGYTSKKGYVYIRLYGELYLAHRLAFLYEFGYLPKLVDHIDGNPSNNSIENLRDVNQSTNMQNLHRSHSDSNTLLGVSFDKKRNKFTSRIYNEGKILFLGRFDNENDAHLAYLKSKRELHAGCAI